MPKASPRGLERPDNRKLGMKWATPAVRVGKESRSPRQCKWFCAGSKFAQNVSRHPPGRRSKRLWVLEDCVPVSLPVLSVYGRPGLKRRQQRLHSYQDPRPKLGWH